MKKNVLEWAVFTLGVVAILGVAHGLMRNASTPDGAPRLGVEVQKTFRSGDRWLVAVTVSNNGGQSAEAVTVRAEAGDQRAEFDIDFVPLESKRDGYLIFRDEPKELKVDVSGAGAP